MSQLEHAVAYFNTDVSVSGPSFDAYAVPSLKPFLRDVTRRVPSPAGGTVYDQWLKEQNSRGDDEADTTGRLDRSARSAPDEVRVGDLGSGSDFTPFLQHAGVPSTDIGSTGPYGVYHSVFDNYNWFIRNADPTFVYEQQQARIFGLEVLHMADSDILPYDYQGYGRQVVSYVRAVEARAREQKMNLNFIALKAAAARFAAAGSAMHAAQLAPGSSPSRLNPALRNAENALLDPTGLPHRPWYKHLIFAPGEYTGYAAVVVPGVTEGIDAADSARTQAQITALTAALNRASTILESAAR